MKTMHVNKVVSSSAKNAVENVWSVLLERRRDNAAQVGRYTPQSPYEGPLTAPVSKAALVCLARN